MKRVDHYWTKVFETKTSLGEAKYPELSRLVKALCALSHGNADVERSFSESGKQVTSDSIKLNEASVNGLHATTDGLMPYGGKPHLVPMTKELISMGRNAHQHYCQRLEEEKRQVKERREASEALLREQVKKDAGMWLNQLKHKELTKAELLLVTVENENRQELHLGSSLLQTANERLKQAIKKKDFKEVAVSHALLDAAEKKMEEAQTALDMNREKQKVVKKRKKSMLDYFTTTQKPKMKKSNFTDI